MIIQTVYFTDFVDAFVSAGRENQFSYDGLRAMFEYLDDLSDATAEPIELDVIALCCEFTEYATATEAAIEYGHVPKDEPDAVAWLEYRTTVLCHDGGVIIANF